MVTVEQFIEGLASSGLMTEPEVREFQLSLAPDLVPPTVKGLAAELVRRGRLTRFQASRVAIGQAQSLVLGKYVIQDKIGEGGMGEVFVAEHRRMKRPVVVKVLPPSMTESEYYLRRFQREVEAAAQLHHPNIVTAFDADVEHGVHFLVMEYVAGEALGQLVQRIGPLPVDSALSCVLQAARGLEYAHAKGIIHRDIKPNNLLLDREGVVKILDMGLARFADSSSRPTNYESLTNDHQIVGTIDYMSPEQVDDSSLADQRSDIYSLGCTLYRLLTNYPPYRGETVFQTLMAHRLEPIPSLRAIRADVPELLDRILRRMMAKSPTDRYQTATDLIRDLETCRNLLEATSPSTSALGGREAASVSETQIFQPGMPERSAAELLAADPTFDKHSTVDEQAARGSVSQLPLSLQAATFAGVPAIGIDLGTTYSAISYLDQFGRPQVLTNLEGDKTTPSVVLLDGDAVVVGKEAVKAMSTDMDRIAECSKRDLGRPFYHRALGGKKYPPEVLQAWILNRLRTDAQTRLGEFRKVVITVPAYFDEVRRKATQDAGYIAGLEVLDIINEPTAAALAFGFQRGRLLAGETESEPRRILVYDLGGGTFDVTIMEVAAGEFVTLATDGDCELGGRDWDQRLVNHVAESFYRLHRLDPRENLNAYGQLLRDCEEAKRTLSVRTKTQVLCSYGGHAEWIKIAREQFEELTADLLERTAFTTRQTLAAAGLEWAQIDDLLLVGGATRMPAVVELLRKLSRKEPDTSISPDEAVAHGAAIHAGLLQDRLQGRRPRIRVRNVNSHSLGVVGTDPHQKRKQTVILIPRNTPLPAKAKRVFKTSKTGQKSIALKIVEGESPQPSECTPIGKFSIREIPPDLPAGTPIEVRFQYTSSGRLQVSVQVPGLADPLVHEVTRENNLSIEQRDQWREHVLRTASV